MTLTTRQMPRPQVTLFVRQLKDLPPNERARFKRHCGDGLSSSPDILPLFYRMLPRGVRRVEEEVFFLVATLFPLADGSRRRVDLGDSLRRAGSPQAELQVRRRLEALLDADSAQLPLRLRRVICLLRSRNVGVAWAQLLDDLLRWDHPEHPVQRRWARSYLGISTGDDSEE